MSALLDSAVASVLSGLQDYSSGDEDCPLGAVQNYYASIFMLAKDALISLLYERTTKRGAESA